MSWLSRWFAPSPRLDPALLETMAWAMDQVEPRLRQVSGYPRRYVPALSHAIAYCRALAQQMPGPVAVSREAFSRNPLVHALFSSPEGIVQALAQSQAVREWQQAHPDGQGVFALLAMRKQEKNLLGVGGREGNLQRDVPQTVVYFSDHTLTNLAVDAEAARALLERQFLGGLLDRVKERVEAIQQEKQRLEKERDELQAQLRAHGDNAALQAALAQTLGALGETVASLDLRRYAEHMDAVLLHPEKFLHLDPISLRLDAMGVRQEEAGAQDLNLCQMTCRDRRRWFVLLAQVPLEELLPYQDRLEAAGRWLAI